MPNCRGCQAEFDAVLFHSEEGLHFTGKGLFEKGHLLMIMVNDKGEIIVG